jgi:hypothetical protein
MPIIMSPVNATPEKLQAANEYAGTRKMIAAKAAP